MCSNRRPSRAERARSHRDSDEREQRVLALQLPAFPDTREHIERQQDAECVQRERQGKAQAPRGRQRTESLPDRAARKSGDGKSVSLDKPQGKREQRADGALGKQEHLHLTAFHIAPPKLLFFDNFYREYSKKIIVCQ